MIQPKAATLQQGGPHHLHLRNEPDYQSCDEAPVIKETPAVAPVSSAHGDLWGIRDHVK